MKLQATLYRGIEFVRIEDLPGNQKQVLKTSPDFPERIKLLIDGKVSGECLLYSAYSIWYAQVYKVPTTPEPQAVKQPMPARETFVLNKA